MRLVSDAGLRHSEAAELTWADVVRWPDGSGRITCTAPRPTPPAPAPWSTPRYARWPLWRPSDLRIPVANPTCVPRQLCVAQLSRRIAAAAAHAGLQGEYSGHSGRVGMAVRMATHGAPTARRHAPGPLALSRHGGSLHEGRRGRCRREMLVTEHLRHDCRKDQGMVKVINWNIGKTHRPLEELLAMDADVALLQEVHIGGWDWLRTAKDGVAVTSQEPWAPWEKGHYDRWPLVVKLSDRVDVEWFKQTVPTRWVTADEIAVSGIGTIAAARVIPVNGVEPFIAISMCARWLQPHPTVGNEGWIYPDASAHRIISDPLQRGSGVHRNLDWPHSATRAGFTLTHQRIGSSQTCRRSLVPTTPRRTGSWPLAISMWTMTSVRGRKFSRRVPTPFSTV